VSTSVINTSEKPKDLWKTTNYACQCWQRCCKKSVSKFQVVIEEMMEQYRDQLLRQQI